MTRERPVACREKNVQRASRSMGIRFVLRRSSFASGVGTWASIQMNSRRGAVKMRPVVKGIQTSATPASISPFPTVFTTPTRR